MAAQQPANVTPPVCVAARDGDAASLRLLLAGGASVNDLDPTTGYRPLQLATRFGHVACLQLILEQADVDVNEVVAQTTALHLAAWCRHNTFEMCRMLIGKGADLTIMDFRGKTPLFYACEHADAEVISLLVNEQTLLRSERSRPVLPHFPAIVNGNRSALAALHQFELRSTAKLSADEVLSIVRRASRRDTSEEMFREIFERYSDRIAPDTSTCVLNETLANRDRVSYLLGKGCKPIAYDPESGCMQFLSLSSAIHVASEEVFDLLLAHISSIDVDLLNQYYNSNTVHFVCHPLSIAYPNMIQHQGQQFDMVGRLVKLLKLGFDPKRAANRHWLTYFELHFLNDSVILPLTNIPFFVNHFSNPRQNDVFARNYFDGSSGILAFPIFNTFDEHLDIVPAIVRLLLEHGASPNGSREDEISPLLALVWRGGSQYFREGEPLRQVFNLFIHAGVKLDQRSERSPFLSPDIAIAAACMGNEVVIEHLLANTDLEPWTLLSDLMKLEFTYKIPPDMSEEHTLCMKLRTNIGIAAKTVLPYTSIPAADLVNQLRSRFTDPIPLEIVERAERNDDDGDGEGRDREPFVWREVEELANQTGRLKHMCRVNIRRLLIGSRRGNPVRRDWKTGLALLNLPTIMREYLAFERE